MKMPRRAGSRFPARIRLLGGTRSLAAAAGTMFTLALASCPAFAGMGDLDNGNTSYIYRFFSDADHVHVVSHYARGAVEFEGGADLSIQLNHDRVILPGIDAPVGSPDAVDAITTASRPITGSDAYEDFIKDRREMQASLGYRQYSFGYYLSSESDYFAQQISGGYQKDAFDQNLNLSLGGSYGWDRIEPLEDADTDVRSDLQQTFHGNVVLTQLLTTTSLVRVGVEFNLVRGLQHNPYRNVYAGGARFPELHPEERQRRDLFLRFQKYLENRSSLRLTYRFYSDDWDVNSQMVGLRLIQYVTEDLRVRYRYRFYDQSGASFYREEYELEEGVDGYRTGDYRLEPMRSHLFGTRLDLNLGAVSPHSDLWPRFNVSVNYERYFNNSNFSANVFETGIDYGF